MVVGDWNQCSRPRQGDEHVGTALRPDETLRPTDNKEMIAQAMRGMRLKVMNTFDQLRRT